MDKVGWGRNATQRFPDGHILIVVPNMLVTQWVDELQRFLRNDIWNIVPYPTSSSHVEGFWREIWPVVERGSATTTTIVVIAHSVSVTARTPLRPSHHFILQTIRRESVQAIGNQSTRENDVPVWRDDLTESTIFSKNWAITFWDEAQWLRTEGPLLRAALGTRVKSASQVLCSATPLYNSEKVRQFFVLSMIDLRRSADRLTN